MELLDRLGHASSKAEDGSARAAHADRLGDDPVARRPRRTRCPAARRDRSRAPRSSSPAARAGSARRSRCASRARARRASRSATSAPTRRPRRPRRSCAALGAEPVLVRGNVTSERVAEQVAALGPLDVLVHNAATGVIRPALETEDKHWDWTLNANARALLALTRVVAPSMPAGSSIVGDLEPRLDPRARELRRSSATSKAALEALVRYLAVELAPRGIRVNAVSGGVVETGALDALPEPRGDARARAPRTRPAGSSRRRTSPARSRSSARPTPR